MSSISQHSIFLYLHKNYKPVYNSSTDEFVLTVCESLGICFSAPKEKECYFHLSRIIFRTPAWKKYISSQLLVKKRLKGHVTSGADVRYNYIEQAYYGQMVVPGLGMKSVLGDSYWDCISMLVNLVMKDIPWLLHFTKLIQTKAHETTDTTN
jgi:hypothetical protein